MKFLGPAFRLISDSVMVEDDLCMAAIDFIMERENFALCSCCSDELSELWEFSSHSVCVPLMDNLTFRLDDQSFLQNLSFGKRIYFDMFMFLFVW